MSSRPTQLNGFRTLSTLMLFLFVAACLGCVGFGVYELLDGTSASGWALVIGGLIPIPPTVMLYVLTVFLHKSMNNTFRHYEALLDLTEMARRRTEAARTLAENSVLSDWAKRIVNRDKDLDYLRDTIHAAIVRQDWESAEHLTRELREFGFIEEASRLSDAATQARRATTEERIAAALERFETLCNQRKWQQARLESARLGSLFPEESRILDLPHEVERRRLRYKAGLLKQYDEAIRAQNLDAAHDLLFELDHYLTVNEAAALRESARGVFKAKLQQMGVQFSLAVSERQYRRAIHIGESLCREFPNSRFAHEIKTMMPALWERAANDGAATQGQHAPSAV